MAFCWDVRDGGGGPPVGHMLPKASGLAGSSLPELSFMGRAEDVSWEGPGKPTWAWFSQSRTGFFFSDSFFNSSRERPHPRLEKRELEDSDPGRYQLEERVPESGYCSLT